MVNKLVPICLLMLMGCASPMVKEGVYKLQGNVLGQNPHDYSGQVTIKRSGDTYNLTWDILPSQKQVGVAYFSKGILSVGYRDLGNPAESGVVHYQCRSRNELEGPWRSSDSSETSGRELLIYVGPEDSSPVPKEKPSALTGELGALSRKSGKREAETHP